MRFGEPTANGWMFIKLHGLAFGLTSAVVTFNRVPTLVTAAARRMHCVLTSAYFDDIPVIDVEAGGRTDRDAVSSILVLTGAPP